MVDIGLEYINASPETIQTEIIDYYNDVCMPLVHADRRYPASIKTNWSMAFLSVLAHKAGTPSDVFPRDVNVFNAVISAINYGLYVKRPIKVSVGDVVIYADTGDGFYNQAGIVQSIENNYVMNVLEGSLDGTVGIRRSIRRNGLNVQGFIMADPFRAFEHTRITELAYIELNRIIDGIDNNRWERKQRLGNDYIQVQNIVNHHLRQ